MRTIFILLAFVALSLQAADKPNFVLIFIDDMGYGDIGPFGNKVNKTLHLDQMAKEGRKLTSFYVASPVCTPSRAALMTGCNIAWPHCPARGAWRYHLRLYPLLLVVGHPHRSVLFPSRRPCLLARPGL